MQSTRAATAHAPESSGPELLSNNINLSIKHVSSVKKDSSLGVAYKYSTSYVTGLSYVLYVQSVAKKTGVYVKTLFFRTLQYLIRIE